MQRLAVTLSAFALIFVMIVNIALFVQNTKLRQQTTAGQAQLQPTQASQSPDQPDKLADLQQKLDRSEQDRIKAARDATAARNQLGQLQTAAQERDTLKAQAQSLQLENQQLKSEVGNLQTMNTINGQVVPLRGLTPLKTVPRNFMNHDQLRDYFTADLDKEWPPEAEKRESAILQALDMGGSSGTGDLRQEQIDSMVKGVLGFYDQNTKQLVVVTEHAKMSVLDKVTYAHEFTHSLQDQHYDLTKLFARAADNSDYASAIRALVEGDATVTMGRYANQNLDAVDRANYQLEQFKDIDLSGMMSGGGGPMVESATYFPYEEGAQFVAMLYQQGGVKTVDAAFKNPPRSSEQILHPQHYFDRDEPIAVRLPTFALSGWHTVAEDTLGELYMRIYLEYQLPYAEVLPAAAGWGGDRYAVLSDAQGRLALALQSSWDSSRDAEEFFDAYNDYVFTLAGGSQYVIQSDDTHMRWQMSHRQFYLSRVGNQVLVLHAPDSTTLDRLIGQFKGF